MRMAHAEGWREEAKRAAALWTHERAALLGHRVATPAQCRRERTFGKGVPIWRPAQQKIFTISGPWNAFSSQKCS